MNEISTFIVTYGLPVFIIACCIIAVIGILKLCKVYDLIKSSEIKKCVYYISVVALSFAGAAIYFAIFNIAWSGYALFVLSQIGATTTLYQIYENLGVRKFVRMIIEYIQTALTNKDSKFTKLVNKIGLDEAVKKLQVAVEAEKQKQEQAKANAENVTTLQNAVTTTANTIAELNK